MTEEMEKAASFYINHLEAQNKELTDSEEKMFQSLNFMVGTIGMLLKTLEQSGIDLGFYIKKIQENSSKHNHNEFLMETIEEHLDRDIERVNPSNQ